MRTTLFLSSLFAITLASGAALAEKPVSAPVKAPRAIEKLRVHGDVLDKVYRGSTRAFVNDQQRAASPERVRAVPNPRTKGESRMLCSDTGLDCAKPRVRSDEKASNLGASRAEGARASQPPAFLQKILGSDRMNCNEADDCSMSLRAARRAWSNASSGHTAGDRDSRGAADAAASAGAQQQQRVEKVRTRRSEVQARVSCNEADDCMMSSKAAKKIWAYESVKAGTWKGPAAASKTPAEKAIEDSKKKH